MARVVNSLKSFSKTLADNGIKSGHGKIIDDAIIGKNGSGSFVLDFLTRGKIGKNSRYKEMQRKLSDFDMKLGGKAYNFLDKKKSGISKTLKKSLVQEHDILKAKGKNGLSDEYIKINRAGITNPIAKTKDAVLPFAGTMAVGSALAPREKGSGEDNYYEEYGR